MSVLLAPATSQQAPQASRKPVRTMTIEADPFGGGLVCITMNGKATTYRTRMIPCDREFGPFAFEFAKVCDDHDAIEPPYHLTCSSPDPTAAAIACECLGFLRWGRCRHSDCLRFLLSDAAVPAS